MRKIVQTKKKKDTINPNNLREKEGQQGWKQKERNQTEETETVREETLEHRHQLKQLNICSRVSVYLVWLQCLEDWMVSSRDETNSSA